MGLQQVSGSELSTTHYNVMTFESPQQTCNVFSYTLIVGK